MSNASSPQKKSFDFIRTIKRGNEILLYVIFTISIGSPFVPKETILADSNFIKLSIKDVVDFVNIALLIAFSVLTFLLDYYLFPNAEEIRRNDFIDNSFGTDYAIHNSEGYFSNNALPNGAYKALVNLFENCLFTYQISKSMIFQVVAKTMVFVFFILLVAFHGFSNNEFVAPILQVFLSANVLGECIKHITFVNKNEAYLKEFKTVFQNTNFAQNQNNPTIMPFFTRAYTNYECNISWGLILLDSKIYNRLNDSLSKMWEDIKSKYNIV